jgi:hypothetical protein
MKHLRRTIFTGFFVAAIFATGLTPAQSLDQIGVTALRAMTTNVDGSGIYVEQSEGSLTADLLTWEVNPPNVGRAASLFTYASAAGSTNVYPNTLGTNSWHAEDVGNLLYGMPSGIATNLARVDNSEADWFVTNYVFNPLLPPIADVIVNQSFTFGNETTNLPTPTNWLGVADQLEIDAGYDDYANANQVLFVSAVNNGGAVSPPGTAYNSIGVAAFGVGSASSVGPTLDNGRCKPDLTAPAGYTSFSTPQVSGAAAVLMQAALRGDGGSDTNSAFDMRTIKALLLNGAVKPADWAASSSSPLDPRYGAGVVNVFNAYEQLAGGKHFFCAANGLAVGAVHPPVAVTNFIAALSGWDFNTNSTSATNDAVNHYCFNVPGGTVTATLVWNRQFGETNINNMALFLFNAANSNLVACSTSLVDNVQQIFVPQLAAGLYDLQVLKNGGNNVVSDDETYALAWAFVAPTLSLVGSGTNAALTWPVYPAGFGVEATINLASAVWSTNTSSPSLITNRMNTLSLNTTNAAQFFRLRSPNF